MKAKWSSSDAVQGRILDAALKVFKERGYTDSTMTDVVQSAGVSIGSIYHHVGGKEDLFAACHRRLRDTLHEALGIDLDGGVLEHGTWEESYLWAVRERRDACAVFLGMNAPSGFEPGRKVAEYYADLDSLVARILAAILVEGMRILCECPEDETSHTVEATVKLLNVVRAVGF